MEHYISIIGVLIVVIGWFIGYFLNKRQDILNKRKEIRINYLLNAWLNLESASNRKNNDYLKNFETSIAHIQLLGTKKQIELAQKCAVELSENRSTNQLELLLDLRNDLRKELQLEKVPDVLKFLRVVENQKNDLCINKNTPSISAKTTTKITEESLQELGKRLYEKIIEVVITEWETAFKQLTLQDCIDYIFNLTINRTFDGFLREKSVVNDGLAKHFPEIVFEESDPELDHAGDIDYIAKVGNKAFGIQIKPVTAKANFGNYSAMNA